MKKSNQLIEVAVIATILGDNFTEKLLEKVRQKGAGYFSTVEIIAEWSVIFFTNHKKVDWQDVLEKGMIPLSKELSSIMSYDEAIIDFGYYKLSKFE